MRLFEILARKKGPERIFFVDLWVDYEAHNGNLSPAEFAEKNDWLEDNIRELAKNMAFEETGSGGYIGAAGGSRDISFRMHKDTLGSNHLSDFIFNSLSLSADLAHLQKEISRTVAVLGLNSMSAEFSYSLSLALYDPNQGPIYLGSLDEMKKLYSGEITIEQLIDNSTDHLGESRKSKIKITPPAPRNFVAKNAKTSGAGAHKTKDKKLKRDEKKLADE